MFNRLLMYFLLRSAKAEEKKALKPNRPPPSLTAARIRAIALEAKDGAEKTAVKIKAGTDEIIRTNQAIRKNYPTRPAPAARSRAHLTVVK